jgi:glycosyltransferase involved in cell wall biosynthesis
VNILIWHVHGSWTTSFVQGSHRYLIPVVPDRGPEGRGRARTWDWPPGAVEVTPEELPDAELDLVIVQRPEDLELWERWCPRRRLGVDVPAIWLEHNAPQGRINELRHPAADRDDIARVVHVTHTNDLFWDCGDVPTSVVEHGIVDPGQRWTGEIEAIGMVVNEPVRRARVTGTDLIPRFGEVGPVDLFGMGVDAMASDDRTWLRTHDDVPQEKMHLELARRRLYVHPFRWTSLGLALLEAMHLGMPVVALATTEAHDAVPPSCGVVSNDVSALTAAAARLLADPAAGAELGAAARSHVRERYSLERFLHDWDQLLPEVTR